MPTASQITADYLDRILKARVYEVAIETPLEAAPRLSARLDNRVLFKREDLQPVFSFKLRGAYNKLVQLSDEERRRGVICSSAGNHAQGVALAARELGVRAVVVMPVMTPSIKVDAVRAFGGEIELHGQTYDDAYAHALEVAKRDDLSFIHPFNDPEVIAGWQRNEKWFRQWVMERGFSWAKHNYWGNVHGAYPRHNPEWTLEAALEFIEA